MMTGTLIVLAFLTTVTATTSRTYRDERYPLQLRNFLQLLPIIVSALVTMGATFSAYYKFDLNRAQNHQVAIELARLESDIGFEIMKQVSLLQQESPTQPGILTKQVSQSAAPRVQTLAFDLGQIGEWRGRLDGIMEKYRDVNSLGASTSPIAPPAPNSGTAPK